MRAAIFLEGSTRGVMVIALSVALPFLLGVAVVSRPYLAPPLLLLIGLGVWVSVRGRLAWWDMLVLVVGGLYVLDHGFANIGIQGPVAMPLADLVAVALVIRIATRADFEWPGSLPFVLAAVFVALTAVRVIADYPNFGVLAIRDATLGLELSFLLIGYWAIHEYGLTRIVRMLGVVFVIGLFYSALYPFRETLESVSPVVGLQRPVPLLGTYAGNMVFVGAFFFFVFVRPFGARSYILAAAALPLLVLVQSRGLYLAVPAAIGMVATLARARAGAQIRRGLAATLAVGALALVVFIPLAPEGRLGDVSTSFVVAQLATLTGEEGPGTPVETRQQWFEKVMARVDETPGAWAIGVGLGPDLAFGFTNEDAVLVRKPHNDYLEVYARYGLLGFLIFMAMLGTAFTRIVRGARSASGLAAPFLWFAVAQTFVIAFISATQPLLAFPYGTVPLFFVLGAALAVADPPRAGRAR